MRREGGEYGSVKRVDPVITEQDSYIGTWDGVESAI
jgi:hypothetical protein